MCFCFATTKANNWVTVYFCVLRLSAAWVSTFLLFGLELTHTMLLGLRVGAVISRDGRQDHNEESLRRWETKGKAVEAAASTAAEGGEEVFQERTSDDSRYLTGRLHNLLSGRDVTPCAEPSGRFVPGLAVDGAGWKCAQIVPRRLVWLQRAHSDKLFSYCKHGEACLNK